MASIIARSLSSQLGSCQCILYKKNLAKQGNKIQTLLNFLQIPALRHIFHTLRRLGTAYKMFLKRCPGLYLMIEKGRKEGKAMQGHVCISCVWCISMCISASSLLTSLKKSDIVHFLRHECNNPETEFKTLDIPLFSSTCLSSFRCPGFRLDSTRL